jgi:flagellin
MYDDVTKSADDKSNYDTEFSELVNQLQVLDDSQFNGVDLFEGDGTGGDTLNVSLVEDGSSTLEISQAQLNGASSNVRTEIVDQTSLANVSVGGVVSAIQEVATQRAVNGAQQSRLQFASETLEINRTNLEAANSRIVDTDIARESTAYAKANILVQSGTAMLAQANATSQNALRLIG